MSLFVYVVLMIIYIETAHERALCICLRTILTMITRLNADIANIKRPQFGFKMFALTGIGFRHNALSLHTQLL